MGVVAKKILVLKCLKLQFLFLFFRLYEFPDSTVYFFHLQPQQNYETRHYAASRLMHLVEQFTWLYRGSAHNSAESLHSRMQVIVWQALRGSRVLWNEGKAVLGNALIFFSPFTWNVTLNGIQVKYN